MSSVHPVTQSNVEAIAMLDATTRCKREPRTVLLSGTDQMDVAAAGQVTGCQTRAVESLGGIGSSEYEPNEPGQAEPTDNSNVIRPLRTS